jgi:hypothetical protein
MGNGKTGALNLGGIIKKNKKYVIYGKNRDGNNRPVQLQIFSFFPDA